MGKEDTGSQVADRHILVAADDSENAKRAVLYVADFLGGVAGFRVTILNVIPEPPEDYFRTAGERESWIKDSRAGAARMLEAYRLILLQAGFGEEKVSTAVDIRACPSVADCILDMQQTLGCCTVVIGRRGISRREEFLFGSTSNKIMRSGKNCAIWVIE